MHKIFIFFSLFLIASTVVTAQSAEEVRKIIEQQNANAARWYTEGNIDSLVLIFAEDAWQMPPNNLPLIGREAIRKFWSQVVQWGKWEFTFQTQDVSVSSGMAVERGKYVLKFTAGSHAPPEFVSFEDHGNYLVHWRLEKDGQWRVVSDAPVSELPLKEACKTVVLQK
jgi:ketosteroid isomerase-like protein